MTDARSRAKERAQELVRVKETLQKQVEEQGYAYVGVHAVAVLETTRERLVTACTLLKESGYTIHYLRGKQNESGTKPICKVLAAPKVAYSTVWHDREKIFQIWVDTIAKASSE